MVRGIRRRHLLQGVGSFDKFQTSFCPSLRNNNKTLQNIDVIVSYKYNFLSSQEKLFFFHFIINKKKKCTEESNTILVHNILRIHNFIHLQLSYKYNFLPSQEKLFLNKKKSHRTVEYNIFTRNILYI